jgi:hypothetical protein
MSQVMSQGNICRVIDIDRSYMSAIKGGKVNIVLAVLFNLGTSVRPNINF